MSPVYGRRAASCVVITRIAALKMALLLRHGASAIDDMLPLAAVILMMVDATLRYYMLLLLMPAMPPIFLPR